MQQPWLDEREAANGRSIRENFSDWFGKSQIVDSQGNPLVVHHATYRDFDAFKMSPSDWTSKKTGQKRLLQAHYFTSNPKAAASFAGGYDSRLIPVYLSVQKAFDYENEAHLKLLSDHVAELVDEANGSWSTMEKHRVVKGIRKAGFDGMFVRDETGKSVAVFDSAQIKSAIGNSGLYLKTASLTDTQAALDLKRSMSALASIAKKGRKHAAALA
jgi:ADP-Ribosyltransferase in polyvalent proteins